MSARLPLQAVLLLIVINLFWAASSVTAKIALTSMGPCTLSFARSAPAAVLLYLLIRLRGGRVRVERRDYGRFFFLGAFGLAATYSIFYSGIQGTSVNEATLLIAAEPILIALMARVALGERLSQVQTLGMAAGFAGLYVIIMRGLLPRFDGTAVANTVIALALCFECYASVVGKQLSIRYSGLMIVAVEMGLGAMVLAPFAVGEIVRGSYAPAASAVWASVAYLSLVCSFFCYGVWFWMLPRYKVSSMAGSLFIQPMMAPIINFLIGGERLGAWTIAGACLVMLGVWLVAIVGEKGRPEEKCVKDEAKREEVAGTPG
jgi:drug/metabolite transporter (DMT)-like permease